MTGVVSRIPYWLRVTLYVLMLLALCVFCGWIFSHMPIVDEGMCR